MHRLVFGCGYLGQRVAHLWAQRGDRLTVVTRSPLHATQFMARGWQARTADIRDPFALEKELDGLSPPDTVLFAVGFDRSAGSTIHDVYVEGLRHVLKALTRCSSSLRSFVYISSTGVYGQSAGEWVDESSLCNPTREGGLACLNAENVLKASPLGDRSLILRCAGLYGPERIPYLKQLAAGEPLAASPEGYLNLIHVDDAARIVVDVADQVPPPDVLNVADGHPVLRGEYYGTLARLLGAPPPRFQTTVPGTQHLGPTPPGRADGRMTRANADKRVNAARLHARLNVPLQYPDHTAGLAHIVEVARKADSTDSPQPAG